MVKYKPNQLLKQWMPKKTVKLENPFAFYVGVLDKYTKKKPKQIPVALKYIAGGPGLPTHQLDTRRFLL